MDSSRTLVVIGGGAAGFFCAVNAARLQPGLRVILLEKTGKLLSKVTVSGGGRCNVTHACFDPSDMAARYPRGRHFVRKAFHRFFTTDTIHWFAERGVTLKTEPDGRMFPVTDSSATIVQCLLREASRYRVDIRMQADCTGIEKGAEGFRILLRTGEPIRADYVCIAVGGYPKETLFDWLQQTGHPIVPPVPSLFTFNLPGHPITSLMGIAVNDAQVQLPAQRIEQRGPLLITHWGLSGPAVLRASAWGARELAACQWQFTVRVNWLPDFHETALLAELKQQREINRQVRVRGRCPWSLPARLWDYLAAEAGCPETARWADLSSTVLQQLARLLCGQTFPVKGKTTFREEFVTAGGIELRDVRPDTMESKILPGLFFAGEVLDVDGITGGYNFQHAWTSGFCAASAVAARIAGE
jgi:predicted Rossmann fold flavoprotein